MNKKNLTLRSIQEQLDLYKSKASASKKAALAKATSVSKALPKAAATADKRNIVVTQKTSFLKSSFMALYALSWIGFIVSKLPFISKYSGVIKLIIGRTTFWTLLVIFRKAFITMNAVIGLWIMFKVTGWSQGSFFMSAAALGSSYMEFFVTFVYKVYYWLFNIMDTKVIPNIPSNSIGSQFNGWNIRPMSNNKYLEIAESAKSWYQPMHPTSVSSWSDWLPSWKTMFYIGVSALTIAVLYSGYLYFTNWNAGDVTPTAADFQGPPVYPVPGNTSYLRRAADILIFNRISNLSEAGAYVTQKILPSMETSQFESVQRANIPISQKYTQYYPFTPYNPTAPWFERLKMCLFAESEDAKYVRGVCRDLWTSNEIPSNQPPYSRGYGEFVEGDSKGKLRELNLRVPDPVPSPLYSPMVNGYGVNPNLPPVPPISDEVVSVYNYPSGSSVPRAKIASLFGDGLMGRIETAALEHKFNSLPPTPTVLPMPLSAEAVAAMDNAAANIPANSTILGREANNVLPKNVHFSNKPFVRYYSDSIVGMTSPRPSWVYGHVSDLSTSPDVNAASAELTDSSDSSDEEEEGPSAEEVRKSDREMYLEKQARILGRQRH